VLTLGSTDRDCAAAPCLYRRCVEASERRLTRARSCRASPGKVMLCGRRLPWDFCYCALRRVPRSRVKRRLSALARRRAKRGARCSESARRSLQRFALKRGQLRSLYSGPGRITSTDGVKVTAARRGLPGRGRPRRLALPKGWRERCIGRSENAGSRSGTSWSAEDLAALVYKRAESLLRHPFGSRLLPREEQLPPPPR
jgi:hypothetical protein